MAAWLADCGVALRGRRHRLDGLAPRHLPTQKVEKTRPRMSSGEMWPVSSPRASKDSRSRPAVSSGEGRREAAVGIVIIASLRHLEAMAKAWRWRGARMASAPAVEPRM